MEIGWLHGPNRPKPEREVRSQGDSVEKGLCREHAHFLKTSDAVDAAGRGGPRQHSQYRSVIFLALLRRLFLPELALS